VTAVPATGLDCMSSCPTMTIDAVRPLRHPSVMSQCAVCTLDGSQLSASTETR
jgi:hypothetical protein